MAFILKRDNQYIRIKKSRPVSVAELKRATKYNTVIEAEKFIENNIRPEERGLYKVVKYSAEKSPSLASIISKPKPVVKTQPPTEITIKADIVSDLKDVKSQVATRLNHRKFELIREMERCDNIILDIRHFARDGSTRLNACQAAKAFYKQQEIDRQRMRAKMELKRINAVEDMIDTAISTAETFDYVPYKPREVEDMTEFLGL